MSSARFLANAFALTRLAETSPAWSLLRARNAPVIIAVLAETFQGDNRQIAGSDFIAATEPILEDIREQLREDLPKTATAYINDWVKAGFLTRRSPQGSREEFYELSPDAHAAMDYVLQLASPQRAATKSRLGTLFSNLQELAADTDPDEATAISRLEAQRDRIQERIDAIRHGGVVVITDDEAVERAREILGLVRDLPTDFARVQAEVDRVDHDLRQSIVEDEHTAADVLENVFRGVDVIGESEAGKAFGGFYEILLDPERSHHFDATLDAVLSRDFVGQLDPDERLQLGNLVLSLDESSNHVHDSMTSLSRSLRRFVQSREAESQHALSKAINEAQALALQLAQREVKPTTQLGVELELTTRQLRSIATWQLHDPVDYLIEEELEVSESGEIDLEALRQRIRDSEIDWQELRQAVSAAVDELGAATIADVLEFHPATQGVASVIGLIKLAGKHGLRTEGRERLRWQSRSGRNLSAMYPVYVFKEEIAHG